MPANLLKLSVKLPSVWARRILEPTSSPSYLAASLQLIHILIPFPFYTDLHFPSSIPLSPLLSRRDHPRTDPSCLIAYRGSSLRPVTRLCSCPLRRGKRHCATLHGHCCLSVTLLCNAQVQEDALLAVRLQLRVGFDKKS